MLPERIAETIQYFSGRTWLLPLIDNWFFDLDPDFQGNLVPRSRFLLITGEPGTGKSMVAAWLSRFGPEPEDQVDRQALSDVRGRIKAAHFFQANTQNATPSALADNLARQLVERLPGFSGGLEAVLAERVVISGEMNIENNFGDATFLRIENLDLSTMLDDIVFQRALHDPLKRLYESGFEDHIILLLDSLDEAYLHAEGATVRLLSNLEDLSPWIRILATTRPDPRVLKLFPNTPKIDLEGDAPDVNAEVYDYVLSRLKTSDHAQGLSIDEREEMARKIRDNADGYFLYAHLVLEDLLAEIEKGNPVSEFSFPAGLRSYYQERLNREIDEDSWKSITGPVLGVISVSKGDGVEAVRLNSMFKEDQNGVETTLRQFKAYLDGQLPPGPFRPFHRSFTEFLLEDEDNIDYHLEPYQMHQRYADYYFSMGKNRPPWYYWDEYGLRYVPDHIAGASRGGEDFDRHERAEELVNLIIDPDFRKRQLSKIIETSEIQRQFVQTLLAVVDDPLEDAVPLIRVVSKEMHAFRNSILKPEFIFDAAAKGDLKTALGNLPLFTSEARWIKAASLLIAWLAYPANPDEALGLLKRLEDQEPHHPPLWDLTQRVALAMDQIEEFNLPAPPPPVPAEIIDGLITRMGGQKVESELMAEYISGVDLMRSGTLGEVLGMGGDEVPMFLAQQDGPLLVAFAAPEENWEQSLEFLQRYLDLHAANPYVYYRNLSLWLLMNEIIIHPGPEWTQKALRSLISTALMPSGKYFGEATPIAILALKAREGGGDARQELDQRLEDAISEAEQLSDESGNSDTWGDHKRRLAALGSAYSKLEEGQEQMERAFDLAGSIPRGFAGYMVPVWLNYLEALHLCGLASPQRIEGALQEALTSAQNINESAFAARATAWANAMRSRWWPFPQGTELKELVKDLRESPLDGRFCGIHMLGEAFNRREYGPNKLPLPNKLLNAGTLREIADQMGLPIGDFLLANAEKGLGADDPIPPGSEVNVPDPDFTSLLACRVSVEVALSTSYSEDEKRMMLQTLIPVVIMDATALDTILARLLLCLPEGAYMIEDL